MSAPLPDPSARIGNRIGEVIAAAALIWFVIWIWPDLRAWIVGQPPVVIADAKPAPAKCAPVSYAGKPRAQ